MKRLINFLDYWYYNIGVGIWTVPVRIFKLLLGISRGMQLYCFQKRAEHHIVRITPKKKKERNRRRK